MNKIPCTSQNTEAKTMPADVCIFDHFGQLSPVIVHSADCWYNSGVKWWIHVSSLVTYLHKNSILLHWNSSKQYSESSMSCCFDQLWANTTPTLNTAFPLTNVHAKWWIYYCLISSTPLSHTTSIYNQWKWVCGVFLVFSRKTAEFGWPEHSASFVSVRPCLKSAYHFLTVVSDRAESE